LNIHHAKEQRAAKMSELKAVVNNPEAFDKLEGEIRALDKDIARAEKVAELERVADAEPDQRFESETRAFSVAKALREGPERLTGREREVHDELSKAAPGETRGVRIPTSLILGEQRAMTTGNTGATVATNQGGLIDRLRPTLAVQQLGATVISGLTGNLDLPRLTGGPSAFWVAEDGPTTASDSTFDKISLAPKTVSGEMYLSRRLTLQNSVALENILRQDLAFVLSKALDKAAIQGGGTNEPSGILTQITEDATASTAMSDIAADLIAALQIDNVDGSTGFLFDAHVANVLRKVKETGTGRAIPVSETLHGEAYVASNNVPLVSAEHPMIFGSWSNLILAFWSGIDVLANPYKDASKGGLWLHAFLDADIDIRHLEGFAWKGIA